MFAVGNSAFGPVTLTVSRKGSYHEIVFEPELGCSFHVRAASESLMEPEGAFGQIGVSRKLLSKSPERSTLAFLIARQLGLYTSGVYRTQKSASALGMAAGIAISRAIKRDDVGIAIGMSQITSRINDQKRQGKVDRFGVFHFARAGFDVMEAERVWKTVSVTHPQVVGLAVPRKEVKDKRLERLRFSIAEVISLANVGAKLVP